MILSLSAHYISEYVGAPFTVVPGVAEVAIDVGGGRISCCRSRDRNNRLWAEDLQLLLHLAHSRGYLL